MVTVVKALLASEVFQGVPWTAYAGSMKMPGWSALHVAASTDVLGAMEDRVEIIGALMASMSMEAINALAAKGHAALHLAVATGELRVTQALLWYGGHKSWKLDVNQVHVGKFHWDCNQNAFFSSFLCDFRVHCVF